MNVIYVAAIPKFKPTPMPRSAIYVVHKKVEKNRKNDTEPSGFDNILMIVAVGAVFVWGVKAIGGWCCSLFSKNKDKEQ